MILAFIAIKVDVSLPLEYFIFGSFQTVHIMIMTFLVRAKNMNDIEWVLLLISS